MKDLKTSTRLLVYAGNLVAQGMTLAESCRMAMVRPLTDDADIRETLEHSITAILA